MAQADTKEPQTSQAVPEAEEESEGSSNDENEEELDDEEEESESEPDSSDSKQEIKQASSEDEEDLEKYRVQKNVYSYSKKSINLIIMPQITLFGLRNERLQMLYNVQAEEMVKSFMNLAVTVSKQQYRHQLLLAFWLAIHMKYHDEAQKIMNIDPIIHSVVETLYKNGAVYIEKEKQRKEMEKRKNSFFAKKGEDEEKKEDDEQDEDLDDFQDSNELKDDYRNFRYEKDKFDHDPDEPRPLSAQEPSGTESEDEGVAKKERKVEKKEFTISTEADCVEIQMLLKHKVGSAYCTNVLRIALNHHEETIASVLVAYYCVQIDNAMVVRAIKTAQMTFLDMVFAFNKNYERNPYQTFVPKHGEPESSDSEDEKQILTDEKQRKDRLERYHQKYRTITLNQIIKTVIELWPDDYTKMVCLIADWNLQQSENFLMSLLLNRQDEVACKYVEHYSREANQELLIFALRNQSEIFLKWTLGKSMMMFFKDDLVVNELLFMLQSMAKTELVLNVLLYADFSVWKQKNLNIFIEGLEEIASYGHFTNRIVLSYNPILTICLACEHLQRIGKAIAVFRHRGTTIISSLVELGASIIAEIQVPPDIRTIFLDEDFKHRTVLNIIVTNGYQNLMEDEQVTALLDELWVGSLTYECDGKIQNFSMLSYIANATIKNLPGQEIELRNLLTAGFQPEVKSSSFSFQYTYRKNSIALIFFKQFLSATLMVILFQYINLKYLLIADARRLKYMKTQDHKEAWIVEEMKEFKTLLYLGIGAAITCLVQVICQFLFNTFSVLKLPMDTWALADMLNALTNMLVFTVLITFDAKLWLQPLFQKYITSMFVMMLCISWLRFMSFMTLIKKFSILLLTLVKMVSDSKTFFALMFMIFFVMIVWFMTLFQEVSIHYNTFMMTFRTLFDAMLGNFSHFGNSKDDAYWEHYASIIFYVGISNVFLLNYLIAIMSTTYEEMMPKGNFAYQSQRYKYIERFSIAMKDQWGYEELVVHPPPLNCLMILLIPSMFKPGMMQGTARVYGKLLFWIENIVYLVSFLLYSFLLVPYIYFRMLINILLVANGPNIRSAIGIWLLWSIFGLFFLTWVALGDTYRMVTILCDSQEDDDDFKVRQRDDEMQDKICIYNEVIDTLRAVMKVFRHHYLLRVEKKKAVKSPFEIMHIKQIQNLDELKKQSSKEEIERDFIKPERFDLFAEIKAQNEDQNNEEGYTVHKDLLIDAWCRFRPVGDGPTKADEENRSPTPQVNKKKPRSQLTDVRTIFGQLLIWDILRNFHLKLYNFSETEPEQVQRQAYKDEFRTFFEHRYQDKCSSYKDTIRKRLVSGLGEKYDVKAIEEEVEQKYEVMTDFRKDIPEKEMEYVTSFLDKFMFDTGGKHPLQVDLKLALKALPVRVDSTSFRRVELFHFNKMQNAITAYQNNSQDKLFLFYDGKNKTRLRKLRMKAQVTKKLTQDLHQLSLTVSSILKKISSMGSLNVYNEEKMEGLVVTETDLRKALKFAIGRKMGANVQAGAPLIDPSVKNQKFGMY